MSLLEDIFLQDEANEAQELERVIEGGDYEERLASNIDGDSGKEDEAEEDKRRVDPTSTKAIIVKNPRFILNPARLTGPRGIQVIPEHFKDFKFKGKGHEKEDLDLVLKKLEHWAYRLYPKFKFEDCLKKIETLGKKRPVMVHLQKIRSDQFISQETVVQNDSSDEETQPEPDEFDKLLQQQIELARATPVPVNRTIDTSVENRSTTMPKATSSPSISEEQRERMLRNRRLAEERRLSKNKATISNITNKPDDNTSKQDHMDDIDSSDEENASEIIRIEVQTHNPDEPEQNTNVKENQSLLTKQKSNSFNSSDDKSNDDEFNALSDENIESHAKKRKINIIDSSEDESNVIKDKIELGDDANCVKVSLENYARKITESNEELNNDLSDIECISKQNESSESNANNRIDIRDIVLENSIIQSTIQGLVENDNNINLERDLINQANINTQSVEESEEMMEVDFSEEF